MPGQSWTLSTLGDGAKVGILAIATVAAVAVTWLLPPIAQDPAYHDFADRRALLGLPNFADVASNLGFLVVAALGLSLVLGRRGRGMFAAPAERWPYVVFFVAVGLVAMGSAYYHLRPTNETLFWDRLPMSVAFMALVSAFVMDRVDRRAGLIMLPLAVALGVASVLYWRLTEAAGHGDLRFYGLVQFYPLLAVPLMCWLFPGRHTSRRHVVYLILWYGAAKASEHWDHEIYALLGNTLGGHSLKHLSAAVAAFMVVAMLRGTGPASRPGGQRR
ncbi:MAG: hypothetical protein ACE5JZ_05450 [Kiloniellales bacterium]